jgi:aspartate carbamoyltransferase catalytic subunit
MVEARHVIDARQFTRNWIEKELFPRARQLQQTPMNEIAQTLVGKRLFYLFYEPSTRTRVSFETAVMLLGGNVAGMGSHELIPEAERLEDRVQVINQYGYDFLLLRYHQEGGARRAAVVSDVPVINAGDGAGQHPTQALLDAYTLWKELDRIDGLRIALVGDLSYERTTTSLAHLLARFDGIKLYLISPHLLRIGDALRTYLEEGGIAFEEARDLREVASELDGIYMTRAHSDRLDHARRFDDGASHYTVDADVMRQLRPEAIVLHPLPRGQELPAELDSDPRIACFRQAQNGLYVRMALLSLLAGQA